MYLTATPFPSGINGLFYPQRHTHRGEECTEYYRTLKKVGSPTYLSCLIHELENKEFLVGENDQVSVIFLFMLGLFGLRIKKTPGPLSLHICLKYLVKLAQRKATFKSMSNKKG